jgi:hypothetical protein
MNTSNKPKEPATGVIEDLEQKLAAARKGKTLTRVPALRRLRNVVRVYVVLGGLSQLFTPMIGVNLRQIHGVINVMEPDLFGISAFFLYVAISWIVVGLAWLLLFAYARFFKQFRDNHIHDIEDTTAMILRIWNHYLYLTILYGVLQFVIFRHFEATAESIGIMGGTLGGMIVIYFVVRHYVKTAQSELPLLVAAAGDDAPHGNYRAWKPLFLTILIGASVVIGLGYWFGGAAGGNGVSDVNRVLAETSKNTNASLPMQIDSQTRWDTTTSGPGRKMTFFYTLVNLSVADLDQTKFIEEMRRQLLENYRSNPSMANFRRMQVELSFVYWDNRGETLATIPLSPSDL